MPTDVPTDVLTDAPINSLINYINDSLLYINNIQYNPTEIYEDISGNLTEDISGNLTEDISGNLTEDISEDNDVILNTLSNYVSTINNIINRRIEEEDNNIMQEVILSSLREQ